MEITGSSAYYAGLSAIQTGQNRVDQAAGQIANTTAERTATSQSSDFQAERLRAVDRSQQMDGIRAGILLPRPGERLVLRSQGAQQPVLREVPGAAE